MTRLNVASHSWVASLANYNFQLYYRAGKTNIDMDALSRVSWPRCMPDTSDMHIQVTAAAVLAVQETALKGSMSPIKAYSSDVHVMDPVVDSHQVICMATDDWHQAIFKLVLPATYRKIALTGCHNDVCHLGLECILDLMCDCFFWPCMAAQAKEHIEQCHLCLTFKAKQPRTPLENIVATHPLELVHLNYLFLKPGKGKEENVLVVTDHFT